MVALFHSLPELTNVVGPGQREDIGGERGGRVVSVASPVADVPVLPPFLRASNAECGRD